MVQAMPARPTLAVEVNTPVSDQKCDEDDRGKGAYRIEPCWNRDVLEYGYGTDAKPDGYQSCSQYETGQRESTDEPPCSNPAAVY